MGVVVLVIVLEFVEVDCEVVVVWIGVVMMVFIIWVFDCVEEVVFIGYFVYWFFGIVSFMFVGVSGEFVLLELEWCGVILFSGLVCVVGCDELLYVLFVCVVVLEIV